MRKLLLGFINKLVAYYKAISQIQSSTPGLRLVSYHRDSASGEMGFLVQVTGKNIFPKLMLRELEEEALLSNFNQADQKKIRGFLSNEGGQPELRIVARTYDRSKKQFVFTIESLDQKRKMTVDNISPLRDYLYKFDQEDSELLQREVQN